jgi:hemerythrin superfamily protein
LEVNILDVLHADHTAVSNLFEETRQAREGDQIRELFEKIRRELEVHIRAEEGIFYPEVERIGPEAADVIATALEQHGDAVVLMGQLAKMQPSAGEYKTKLKELEDGVKKHIHFEEDQMFKLVREHFGSALDDLGERVKNREEALKTGGQIAGSE